MGQRKVKIFIILTCLGLLNACALAPGLRMDESKFSVVEDSSDSEYANIQVYPITAHVIAQQVKHAQTATNTSNLPVLIGDDKFYHIGAQDVLQITVWDHPELTTPAGQYRGAAEAGNLVREDGTIFYPYVGVLHVEGMNIEELRVLLKKRLAPFVKDPQLDVRVAAFRSQKVYVTGEVMKPGTVSVTNESLRIMDAVDQVGGIKVSSTADSYEADLEHVTLSRDGQSYAIDMLRLFKDGDITQNIRLKDGDILHVPDNAFNRVFVMGEVARPTSLPIHHGHLSLIEAIGNVGGFNLTAANTNKVYVIRGVQDDSSKQAVKVFRLDASSPDALVLADQFKLESRDIVYVSTAEVVRWGRVLGQLSSTIQTIAIARTLTR